MEQIENTKAREVQNEAVQNEKGLALPIPGTKAASELATKSSQMNEEEEVNKLSFADELKKGPVKNSENNTTILVIIAGVILAGIIGGVVFKLKKN